MEQNNHPQSHSICPILSLEIDGIECFELPTPFRFTPFDGKACSAAQHQHADHWKRNHHLGSQVGASETAGSDLRNPTFQLQSQQKMFA